MADLSCDLEETTCSAAQAFSEEKQACFSCAPKMAITPEEEWILGRMRSVKEQVRTISKRLKEIEGSFEPESGAKNAESDPERRDLYNRLNRFRDEWKEWEVRLDEATERKLIMLGHRQPILT
jgi:hypothetical protein